MAFGHGLVMSLTITLLICAVLWFVVVLSCSGASFQVLPQALHSEPFPYLAFKWNCSESQVWQGQFPASLQAKLKPWYAHDGNHPRRVTLHGAGSWFQGLGTAPMELKSGRFDHPGWWNPANPARSRTALAGFGHHQSCWAWCHSGILGGWLMHFCCLTLKLPALFTVKPDSSRSLIWAQMPPNSRLLLELEVYLED